MIEIKTNYKLIIPTNVEKKIRIICKEVWEVEWSGILFYTVGNKDDKNLYCKDFVVLDIGTAGTTEFQMSPKVISYMTENNLLDCYTGLIHSHNQMPTFLSTTDLNTLENEGKDTENFLSLVVNNKGEYTAALTFKQSIATSLVKPLSLFGETIDNTIAEPQITESIVYAKLDIINVFYSYNENTEYTDLKEVQEEAKAKSTIIPNNIYANYIPRYNPIQQTMFSDRDFKFSSSNSKYSIQDLAVKIMLGSINVVAKSVKINEILPKLDALYTKTFGSLSKSTRWFEDFIDFILIDFDNPTKTSSNRAQELIDYFESLKTDSKVIEIIIKTIEIYI